MSYIPPRFCSAHSDSLTGYLSDKCKTSVHQHNQVFSMRGSGDFTQFFYSNSRLSGDCKSLVLRPLVVVLVSLEFSFLTTLCLSPWCLIGSMAAVTAVTALSQNRTSV